MTLLYAALLVLWLALTSVSTPIYKERHPKYWVLPLRRSPPLPRLDRHAILGAQTAALRKFRNASALLAGQGTSLGYTLPSSLQTTYNRASDSSTSAAFLSSRPNSSAQSFIYSAVASVANITLLGGSIIDLLTDETDGVNDFEYYGQLSFGSQAQSLQIDFDTGSADLWVPVDCDNCGLLTQFHTNVSRTFRNMNQPFAVEYGEGSVTGTIMSDTVRLASLEVPNQYFGGVHTVSKDFFNSPSDGIAGLAFSTIASSRQPTFFENLIPQLQAPLFSVYLSRSQIHGSEICFGGIDVQKARESTISWVPVSSKTYWTVNISSVLVNDEPVHTVHTHAIIDTGTSFIYGPSRFVSAIYDLIPGSAPALDAAGFHTFPCDTHVALSFVLGPHTFSIDTRDISLGTDAVDRSQCIGAIASMGSSADVDFFILGDSFLKSYVSVYDYAYGGRVGFLESVNE